MNRFIDIPSGIVFFKECTWSQKLKTAEFPAFPGIPGVWTDVRKSGGPIVVMVRGYSQCPAGVPWVPGLVCHFLATKLGSSCFTPLNLAVDPDRRI